MKQSMLLKSGGKSFLAVALVLFLYFAVAPVLAVPSNTGNTVFVCTGGAPGCDFSGVQTAINDSNASTIYVNVTTGQSFAENIDISKAVWVQSNYTGEASIQNVIISSNRANISRFNLSGGTPAACGAFSAKLCFNGVLNSNASELNISASGGTGVFFLSTNLSNLSNSRVFGAAQAINLGINSSRNTILNNNLTATNFIFNIGVGENNTIQKNYFETSSISPSTAILYLSMSDERHTIYKDNLFQTYSGNTLTCTGSVPSNLTFQNNTFFSSTTFGNGLGLPSDSRFLGNRMENMTHQQVSGAWIGTCSGSGLTNINVTENVFRNLTSTGSVILFNDVGNITNTVNISNNSISNFSGDGINIGSGNAFIYQNIITNGNPNYVGIRVTGGNVTIRNNNISTNITFGINITATTTNLIFNNYVNTTGSNAMATSANVLWNTTTTVATNIIGGGTIAGNFWSGYTGVDNTGDGIGDTLVPYTSAGNIITGGDSAPIVTAAGTGATLFNLYCELNNTLFWNNNKCTANASNVTFVNFTIQAPNGTLIVNDANGTFWSQSGTNWLVNSSLVRFDRNGTWYVNVSAGNSSTSSNQTMRLTINVLKDMNYSITSWSPNTGNNTNVSISITANWSTNETLNNTCEHIWPNQTDASNFTYGCEPSNRTLAVNATPWGLGNFTFNIWARAGGSSIYKTYLWNVSMNLTGDGYHAQNITVSYALASTSATLNWTNSSAFSITGNAGTSFFARYNINNTGNTSITNINVSCTNQPAATTYTGTCIANSTNFNLSQNTIVDITLNATPNPASTTTYSNLYWYALGIDGNGNSVNMTIQDINQHVPMSGTVTVSGDGGSGGGSGGGGGREVIERIFGRAEFCGDLTCQANETFQICPSDCPLTTEQVKASKFLQATLIFIGIAFIWVIYQERKKRK